MKKVLLSSAICKWRNLGMECWDIFSKLMKLINGRVKTRTPGSLNLGSKCLWTSPCWASCHHVHTPDFPYIVCAQLGLSLCDPDTAALQGPLSMEFSRQEYWSRLLFPLPSSTLLPQDLPPKQIGSCHFSAFNSILLVHHCLQEKLIWKIRYIFKLSPIYLSHLIFWSHTQSTIL